MAGKTFDPVMVVQGGPSDVCEAAIVRLARAHGLAHVAAADWMAAADLDLADEAHGLGLPVASFRAGRRLELLLDLDVEGGGSLALLMYGADGAVHARAHAATPAAAHADVGWLRDRVPAVDPAEDDPTVPVTFWVCGTHGPRALFRRLAAPTWGELVANYTPATVAGLERLMDPAFRPGVGGQLLLWTGAPGTGKTTALRALAREWRSWCSLSYVVDPDRFFGGASDYMIDVMVGGDETVDIDQPGGRGPGDPRWRLLVLEDCGELLQPDAKREVGQALARLLNTCDGLIGQGLRVLLLVTTNEPVTKLHDAVARPGRCAARVEFETFGALEGVRWLVDRGVERDRADRDVRRLTLAELYARLEGREPVEPAETLGFAR